MRLIDADEFKKQIAGMAIKNGYSPEKANALCKFIDNQPTAYNLDKVLKELNEEANEADMHTGNYEDYDPYSFGQANAYDNAIQIVKEGAK